MDVTEEVSQFEFDLSTVRPSVAVVEALADAEHVDSAELFKEGTTLYEYINPDALNRLFTGPQSDTVDVSFTINKIDVQIRGDGTIEIEKTR
ncbi:HalOD1 output domain-containing protein [Haloplanus aerogenes]|uniref:Halobacterial output domain-containing protein n=1 Tax=Haloplanus aerogenes TaxID=660522 RepID=A0A3M0CN15_9EURY|nr:HalOD1 output domain-containing protein [Haloplanus aerogenes]AZH24792.1 hypothetical protein DU502_05105 [Haloplanus aerogenes]RMB08329.1 hypothetical protein ATH50_3544 [Haloplanus aerogenes]